MRKGTGAEDEDEDEETTSHEVELQVLLSCSVFPADQPFQNTQMRKDFYPRPSCVSNPSGE